MTRTGRPLPRAFYDRDPLEVAPDLLNKVLESTVDGPSSAAVAVRVRIVEVEAYRGAHDPASHAFRGETPRNASMFGPPGHLYVYFTYGMHWCANVVCDDAGVGHAVLLRAAAPLSGLDTIRDRRGHAHRERDLLAGPARLTQALGITGELDGANLRRPPVRLLDDGVAPPAKPATGPRIGITVAVDDPWRYCVPDDPNLSRPG